MSELSDLMTFMERVKIMTYVLYFDFWFQTFNEKWNQIYSEALGNSKLAQSPNFPSALESDFA